MRSLLLAIAVLGCMAAETPPSKPAAPPPLKTAERLALTKLHADRMEIEKQINTIMSEACADRQLNADRCRMNPDGTFFEMPAPPPPPKTAAKEPKK